MFRGKGFREEGSGYKVAGDDGVLFKGGQRGGESGKEAEGRGWRSVWWGQS